MSFSRFLILFLFSFFSSFSFAGPWIGPGNVEYGSTQEIIDTNKSQCLASGFLNPAELEYYCAFVSSRMWQDGRHLYFNYKTGVKNAILGSVNDRIPITSSAYIQLDTECPDGSSPDGTCLPPPAPDPKECEVGDQITRPTYSPPGGSPTPSPQICSNQCLYDFERRSAIGLEEPDFPGVGKYTAYYLGNGQSCTVPTPPETPPDPTDPPPPDPVDPPDPDPTDPEPGGGTGGGSDGGGSDGGGSDGGGSDGGGNTGGGETGNGNGSGDGDGDGDGNGNGNGGTGTGEDGDEEQSSVTGGRSCDSPPVCNGDAVQCAILDQQYITRCNAEELYDYEKHKDKIEQLVTGSKFELQDTSIVEMSSFVTGHTRWLSSTCPADETMSLRTNGGRTFSLSYLPLCNAADAIAPLIVIIATLLATLYVGRGAGG